MASISSSFVHCFARASSSSLRYRGQVSGREIPGGHAVCRDREILDSPLGPVLSLHLQVTDVVTVKDRLCLDGFQTQRPVEMPQNHRSLRCQWKPREGPSGRKLAHRFWLLRAPGSCQARRLPQQKSQEAVLAQASLCGRYAAESQGAVYHPHSQDVLLLLSHTSPLSEAMMTIVTRILAACRQLSLFAKGLLVAGYDPCDRRPQMLVGLRKEGAAFWMLSMDAAHWSARCERCRPCGPLPSFGARACAALLAIVWV
jgi:hypothetical protein